MRSRERAGSFAQRWYPQSWWARYGSELEALLDDSYGEGSLPRRVRYSLMRAGSWERLRASGVIGDSVPVSDRIRSNSLVVLFAWALFVVAGSAFAKYSEHWDAVTPQQLRGSPSGAFVALQLAAFIGAGMVAGAALLAAPAFSRFVRDVGWMALWRLLRAAVLTSIVAVTATIGVIEWAHHLSSAQRNGALWPYGVAWAAWVITVTSAIAVGVGSVAVIVSRLTFSRRTTNLFAVFAITTVVAMSVIFVATLIWWVAIATSAPWFFGSGVSNSSAGAAPAAMVLIGLTMFLGLSVAIFGASRVVRSLAVAHHSHR